MGSNITLSMLEVVHSKLECLWRCSYLSNLYTVYTLQGNKCSKSHVTENMYSNTITYSISNELMRLRGYE